MAKLAENSFRDVNIAYANELSMLCDEYQIDVWELITLANRHPRVEILQPGAGVGGHCIAVDPWFLVNMSPNGARLVKQARLTNQSKPHWVIEKVNSLIDSVKSRLPDQRERVKVACLGLAFQTKYRWT